MPWKPQGEGDFPTLGYYALDWMAENLAAPDREDYEPFYPTQEQADFLLRFYELDPETGRRIIRRAVLSRSRGWGKSPFLSAIGILEGLGEVYPDGWDADGQPVGKPWSRVRTPLVILAAATELQTKNAWDPLLEMLRPDAPVFDNYDGIEPMGTFVNLPRGQIRPVPASPTTTKGGRPILVLADQTEQWTPSNGGVEFAKTLVNNASKVGGAVIESPNAYTPGLGSVAENTAQDYELMRQGKTKIDRGRMWDHREAPAATDITDRESLVSGLRWAYGCSSDHPDGCVIHDPPCAPGWAPIEIFADRFWDTDAEEQDSRADFLNQITHASDSWLASPEWKARKSIDDPIKAGDVIVLGFDGSRGRAKGKPDATALIGCRVRDGHIFQVEVWEASEDKATWDEWTPPIAAIEAAIESCFKTYQVAGMYADPGRDWRSYVNAWEAAYGSKAAVKVTQAHPFEWWMTGGRATKVEAAVEALEGAVRNGDMTHDGSFALTAHVLNARRRLSHGRLRLDKSAPGSTRKIDAAVAAVLAWQARLDALAAGHGRTKKKQRIQRIR